MKNLRTIIFLIIFFSIQNLYAQKEGNMWFFGENAGVDFNSGVPVADTKGQLSTYEGCATICNTSGDLLFYTDGIKVWNNLHSVMPNGTGLKGNPSSTQSGIIVPFPLDTTKYYVFTVTDLARPDGFQYSIVDMTKDNGKGEVTTKNVQLENEVCEKLTAVQHYNKKDIWVIVHLWNSRKFAAYLVTEKGIEKPVYSETGIFHGGIAANSLGTLKASPDGRRLGCVRYNAFGDCQVFDFDNKTGDVSKPIFLDSIVGGYGLEFSPNGKLLYVGSHTKGEIYQYNLDDKDTASIKNKAYTVAMSMSSVGALQLGPDKKIYISQYLTGYLHTIEKPNEIGSKCDLKQNTVYLGGKRAQLGLPAFIQSFFEQSIGLTFDGSCSDDSVSFYASSLLTPDKWEWDFGDPASGANNTSNLQEPKHKFSSAGKYLVKLVVTTSGITQNVEKEVTIFSTPTSALGPDKIICDESAVKLDAGIAESYNWSTGETTKEITINKSGAYWVVLKNGPCEELPDTINITYINKKDFELGPDIAFCEGEKAILRNSINGATFTSIVSAIIQLPS